MAKREYSAYQKGIINRYYDNQQSILLQKLQELVTELYLADTDHKRKKLWQRVNQSMIKLKIQPAIIEHIMSKASVEVLAKNVAEWVSKKTQE
jgi:phosphoribosyl-ATP pyrophosphohydrolase